MERAPLRRRQALDRRAYVEPTLQEIGGRWLITRKDGHVIERD